MTLSFNKTIYFPSPPKNFEVNFHGKPPLSVDVANQQSTISAEEGKKEATEFYQKEVDKLRGEFAEKQNTLLLEINNKVDETLSQLDKRLPDLVMAITERILPSVKIDGDSIKSMVVAMIGEFSEEDEKLDVYLCKHDLDLLKGLSKSEDTGSTEDSEQEGFASAIAGIFEGLDGDESLLDGYPNVKFFEDESLQPSDIQIKSRFGLLDGRISTKLRKLAEELSGND